jgi:hypothetical protein
VRRALAGFVAAGLMAQVAPLTPPPYDPNDPEGIVIFENKTGRFAHKRKGTWTVKPLFSPMGNPQRQAPVTAAERREMTATLDALTPILRATTEGSNPVGYFMVESRTYYHQVNPAASQSWTPLNYSTTFYPFYIADTLRNGVYVPDKGGETQPIEFAFNRLPGRFGLRVVGQEATAAGAVEFYLRPQVTATFAGFPLIENSDLLIARAGRDPWVAVPYGRALKAAMELYEQDRATAEARLANLKAEDAEVQSPEYEQKMRDHLEKTSGWTRTKNPNNWKVRQASMERELLYNREQSRKKANPQRDKDGYWYWAPVDAYHDAARRLKEMTPELAAKPACFVEATEKQGRYALPGDVVAAGAVSNCREVVMDHWGYFDAKRSRSAPQIFLVRQFTRCAKIVDGKLTGPPLPQTSRAPLQGCYRHVPIWAEMDWTRIAALVNQ